MTGLLLFLLPALAAAVGNPEQQIVNGQSVNIADFPWQGSFRTALGSHTCGCVFVGYGWVLTAAHCGGSTAYTVEFGASTRGQGRVWGVQWLYRHPNFEQGVGTLPNDITIVGATSIISGTNIYPSSQLNLSYTIPSLSPFSVPSLSPSLSLFQHPNFEQGVGTLPNDITIVGATSIISGTNIYPGYLAQTSGNPGGSAWITGWGKTCGSCGLATALQGVSIPIISDSQCSSSWGFSFQSSMMICVYSGVSGGCQGDSGGPMVQNGILYGLTSWGNSNCNVAWPTVYTRVGAYKNWVCSNTYNEAYGC